MKKIILSCVLAASLSLPVHAAGLEDAKAGLELEAIGLDEIAMQSFEDALKDPALTGAAREKTYYNLGTLRLRAFALNSAVEAFDAALALDPKQVRTLINRGQALRIMGKEEEALASLDRALAIEPRNADALLERGLSLLAQSRAAEAEKALRASLSQKDIAETRVDLGRALVLQQKFKEALKVFDDAIDDEPKLARAYLYRSTAYHGLGEKRKSGSDLAQAAKLSPSDRVIQTLYEQRRFGKKPAYYKVKADTQALSAPNAKAPAFVKLAKGMIVEAPSCDKDGWCRAFIGSHLVGYMKKTALAEVKR